MLVRGFLMLEDIIHNGVLYRIIGEHSNISHPEGAAVTVITFKSKGHTKLWEQTGTDAKLREMVEAARSYVNGILRTYPHHVTK
jgi:hypothetical protein